MFNYKIVAVFCAGLLSMGAMAQHAGITGTVLDSLSGKPLSGATIIVKNAQGNTLANTIADKNGSFAVQLGNLKNSTITFSYVQFAEKIIDLSNYGTQENIALGKIFLTQTGAAFSQVVVQGRKPPVAIRFDKQVYKADAYNNATGGSAVDVLRNLPAISVDATGGITLRGATNFLLLLNGKAVQGDAATMLAQIPAGSIENIELITNPSAEYDAEGRAGIINIVTKNFKQDGWVLQATLMGGLPTLHDFDNERNARRYSGEVSSGFRKNKFDVSSSINYQRNDMSGYREGEVFTMIDNRRTDFPSRGERSFERYNYGLRLSAGYDIDKNNNLTVGFYHGKRFQVRDANLFYNNTSTQQSTGAVTRFDYYNPNRQQKEGLFTLANLAYEHKFSAQQKITFTGLYERANLTGLTTNLNVRTPGSRDTLQYTLNPSANPLDAWRAKVDYVNKGFSMGYQFRYDVQNGNFLYLTQLPGTPDFEVDDAFTSGVRTQNYIHAGYVQYKQSLQALTYAAGLRLETTDRTLAFSKDNATRSLSLVNLFPNAQLNYKLPDRWNVKAGYSRRIRRTNNFELNPFPEREHSETLEQGDPDLLPELIGTFELGIDHQYNQGSFFVTLYFQRIQNPIQRTNDVYADTILSRLFTNGNRALQAGLEAGSTHDVTSWWKSILGFNIYYYAIDGSLFGNTIQAANTAWAYTINATQAFALGRGWSGQLAVSYLSNRPTLQGEDSYYLNPSASLKKTSSNKKWTFQLLCQNADWGWGTSNRQRITTRGTNFFTTTNYIYEVNQLQLSASFSLMKYNRKIALPESEIGEKEF